MTILLQAEVGENIFLQNKKAAVSIDTTAFQLNCKPCNLHMEAAGVEPASKHIATQKSTLIVSSIWEIRLIDRRVTGYLCR